MGMSMLSPVVLRSRDQARAETSLLASVGRKLLDLVTRVPTIVDRDDVISVPYVPLSNRKK